MRLNSEQLNNIFVATLGDYVKYFDDLASKPLELSLKSPLPSKVRIYLYNATHPPGGRTLGEHKIQLILPGHVRGGRADLDHSGGAIPLIVGYEPELEVFIFWDAGLYRDIPYSRNVQVKAETVCEAYSKGVARQERILWSGEKEMIVSVRKKYLVEGIRQRIDLSIDRLVGGK